MSGIELCKMIFSTVIVVLSLVMVPGCTNNRGEDGDASIVAATLEPISQEESTTLGIIDSESDKISKYEMKDLEKNHCYPVCDFDLVQNETTITIISCQWDSMSNLRIGIKGQNGVETSFDTSNGLLSILVPNFEYLPSGKYTLYVENIDDERISSVSLYYSIN